MKPNKDLKYNHPTESWLPFENFFVQLQLNIKSYLYMLLPFALAALVIAGVVFFGVLSWGLSGQDVGVGFALTHRADEYPAPWVQTHLDTLKTSGFTVAKYSSDTVVIQPKYDANAGMLDALRGRIASVDKAVSRATWTTIPVLLLCFGLALYIGWGRMSRALQKSGKRLKEDQHIRGSRVLPPTRLSDSDPEEDVFDEGVRSLGSGDLPLIHASVRDELTGQDVDVLVDLPHRLEVTHLLMLAGTGGGKTQRLFPMLKASLDRGTKNVVFDVKGDFTSLIFDPSKMDLFAPFDSRSLGWNPLVDLHDLWDCREFAEVLIPQEESQKSQQSYFVDAPRDLLAAILWACHQKNARTNKEFLDVLRGSVDDIVSYIETIPESRPAATSHLMGKKGEQAAGVMGTLRTKVLSLDLLYRWPDLDKNDSFSFQKYILDNDNKRSLIMQSLEERESVVAPLLSVAYNIMFKAACSSQRPDDDALERRILFFFDELAQLNKMNNFVKLMQKVRSKNSGVIAAVQAFGALRKKYGQDILEEILNNFTTLIVGKLNETKTLEWIEKRIGKEEYMQYQAGLSFGPEDFSDRMTANRNRKERFAVMGSEVSSLPPLTYFFMVDRFLTKISAQYTKYHTITDSYVPIPVGVKTRMVADLSESEDDGDI